MSGTVKPIEAPAAFVPCSAVSFGEVGAEATAVTSATPLPTRDAAFASSAAVAFDTNVTPGRALLIVATAAGNLSLVLADGSALTVPVSAGLTLLPFAVARVNSVGTTAALTLRNLG